MKLSQLQSIILLSISLCLSACNSSTKQSDEKAPQVTVAPVQSKNVAITERYVGEIRSHHRIDVRSPAGGLLESIGIKEAQMVKQGDVLFQVRPKGAEEQQLVDNGGKVISITAPFDGMVGRLPDSQSVKKGETLTTLADDSEMWVYFNVPEARYLDLKSDNQDEFKDDVKIELVLANGKKFEQPGKLGAIAGVFNHATGNIPFRADFPNPDRLLRNGEPTTVLISRVQNDAVVIPQHAAFALVAKQYVFLVDENHVAHQREIAVQNETDDIFIIKKGLAVGDKIIVDGARQVHDGDKVKYDDPPKNVAAK